MSDHVLCLGTWGCVRPSSVLRDMGLCQTIFCAQGHRVVSEDNIFCAQGFGVVRQHHLAQGHRVVSDHLLCSRTQGGVRPSSVLRDTGWCQTMTMSCVLRDTWLCQTMSYVLRDTGWCHTVSSVLRDTGWCQTIYCAQGHGVVSNISAQGHRVVSNISAQGHRMVSDHLLCSGTRGCVPSSVLRDTGLCQTTLVLRDTWLCQTTFCA